MYTHEVHFLIYTSCVKKFFSIAMQLADCWSDSRKNDLVKQDATADPIVANRSGEWSEGKGGGEALTRAARV